MSTDMHHFLDEKPVHSKQVRSHDAARLSRLDRQFLLALLSNQSYQALPIY